jgi:hypothetical protein
MIMNSPLLMSEHDIVLFLEVLDNTLHLRGKEGPGGYLSGTFTLKYVLFALRCFLTHSANQNAIAKQVGNQMNTLLIKAVAYQTIYPMLDLADQESADYACFSLYLQSSYGFESLPFLPCTLASSGSNEIEYFKDISARVLSSYQVLPNISIAGRHAATQLLQRLRYLKFEDRPVGTFQYVLRVLYHNAAPPDQNVGLDCIQYSLLVVCRFCEHGMGQKVVEEYQRTRTS